MNETEIQFRTAAFGGFQKQDVLTYLENSAREHAEEVAALQKKLSDERAAAAEGEKERGELESRLSALKEENQRLAADLTEREAALSQLAGHRDELERRIGELQARVGKLDPAAAAYESIKDRTASIELEAHGRARAIEMRAYEKVKKSRTQMMEWFSKMQASYDQMHMDFDGALARIVQELDQARQNLGELSQQLFSHDEAWEALKSQVESLEGPQPPQPLPLEEEEK